MAEEEELDRSELEAVLETRRELGASYDAALVDSFADRIEAAVAARVADEVASGQRRDAARTSAGPRQLALGIVSAVMGVPVSAITLAIAGGEDGAGASGLIALLIGWGGLVGINVAHAAQSRGGSVSRR